MKTGRPSDDVRRRLLFPRIGNGRAAIEPISRYGAQADGPATGQCHKDASDGQGQDEG